MKLKLSLILILIFCTSIWAQQKIHPFPASGNLNVPAGITSINVKAWGGGGAGGSATTPAVLFGRAGAGGGGGSYAAGSITLAPGTATVTAVVATQTAGGSGSGTAGGYSTITGFEGVVYAGGGGGGTGNTTVTNPTGTTSIPAGTAGVATAGTTKTNGSAGGAGVTGLLAITISGAGGNSFNDGAGNTGTGGAAINSDLGSVTSAGNPGNLYGGGGSGAVHSHNGNPATQNGGAGARGHIILDYTCNLYGITATAAANTCVTLGTTAVNLTSSAANLPLGTYTVTYNTVNPTQTALTATMTVTTAGIGGFTATGFNTPGTTSTVTVTNLASQDCTNAVSTGNISNTFTVSPASVGGSVTPDKAICSGLTSGVLTLASNIGTVVRWESSVSPFSTWIPITNTLTTYTSGVLNQTTRFRAVVQSGTCTSIESNPTTVTVNPLPSITLGTVAPVCTSAGAQNTTLAYSGATNNPTTYSIVWNASPTNTFVTVTDAPLGATPISIAIPAATAAGTYTGTITLKNGNSCTSSPGLTFSVVVNPLPSITLGTVAPVCTSAGAQNTTLAYSAATNNPTTYSIVWNASPTNSFVTVTDAPLSATPISIAVPAATAAGTYTGTITVKNGNSCTSSPGLTFSVVVNPLPSITLGTVAPVCTSAGAQNTTLAYSAATNNPTTYSIVWNASPTNNFAAITDAPLSATPISIAVPAATAAGTYTGTITVKNGNSCTSSPGLTFSVVVNPLPSITLGTVAPVCTSAGAQNTTLAYSAATNNPTTYSIVWNASPTNSFVTVTDAPLSATPISIAVPAATAAGTYTGTITVKNGNSCTSSPGLTFSVVVNPLPSITLGTVAPVCTSAGAQNTTLAYSAATNNPTTYSIVWNASPTNTFVMVTDAPLGATPISIAIPAATAAGTYTGTITVKNGNSCTSSPGLTFNVVVNPLPSITLGTVAPVCISESGQNTNLIYTGVTNAPITYSITWNVSPTNSFVTVTDATLNASPISIAVPAGTAAGTYTGTITVKNGSTCTSSPGVNFNVVINALPSPPVIGTITPRTCLVASGSIALSGLPVGGTLTLFPGAIVEPYSGTTATISGLVPNIYTFTVNNGSCTSLVSANAVVSGLITNTYTTSWSNGTPTMDQNIVFAGNYVSAGGGTGDINGCSCVVNSGVSVTISSFDTLTLTNSLSNNGGSLTFENNSSLLQITNAVNTGNITYKRIARQIRQSDFTYWSTPVTPQRLINVSPLTPYDMFFSYTTSGWALINPTNNMVIGKGYIIRAPNNYSNSTKTDYPASFIGVPNNGNLSGETVVADKFYLVGNPYPSALNVSAFLAANPFLDGTIYLWTHNTPVNLSGAYRYNADDYASYNITGGVGGKPANSGNSGNNNNVPSGNIGAGQSFFASTTSPGTIVFNNLMRFGGVDNSQFFKSSKSETPIERHRLWLNMTNEGGAFKQLLIGYVEGASNEYENRYDGKSFNANPYLDFYSIANDNDYVIQGRALPFIDTDTVALGYRSTITGEFTIAIDHTDGVLSTHAIYLEDKITNTIHDLSASNYIFNTSTGTFKDRFVVHYTNKSLGTGDFENEDKNVLVSVKNKAITISSNVDRISTVYIYDFSGKLLLKRANISDTILKIDNLKIADQVLLVKVVLDTNATKTYKIIY